MVTKKKLVTVLKKNKCADQKLVLDSLALIEQVRKLGAAPCGQKQLSQPYEPRIRAMQLTERAK